MRISDWSSDVCSSDLYIEGSDERAAHLDLVVGEGRLQSATGDVADLDVAGLVRIVNGHAEYDDEAGWRLTAEKASIGQLLAVEDQIGRASCRERVCQ